MWIVFLGIVYMSVLLIKLINICIRCWLLLLIYVFSGSVFNVSVIFFLVVWFDSMVVIL